MPKASQPDQVQTPQEILKQQTSAQKQEDKPSVPKTSSSASPPDLKLNQKTQTNHMKKNPSKNIALAFIIVLAGTLTGYGISKAYNPKTTSNTSKSQVANQSPTSDKVKAGDVFGIKDNDTFRDPAEGVVVKGGIDGEGSHHLIREGGPSRNVYLTSSVVDLDLLVNHQVKVWGETFAAQKAGWLMDVGRVEVIKLNAEKPFEEEPADDPDQVEPE